MAAWNRNIGKQPACGLKAGEPIPRGGTVVAVQSAMPLVSKGTSSAPRSSVTDERANAKVILGIVVPI